MTNFNEFRCYHITTEDRLESILKYGLVPNSPRNRGRFKTPHIMLSLYPVWSLYNNFKKKQRLILIEIKHHDITKELFDNDPEGLAWEYTIEPMYISNIIRFEVIR
jgi:hypothetical protein